jgi:flagellar basal body-associated protein FliL
MNKSMDKLIVYLIGVLILIILTILFYNFRGELNFILMDKAQTVDAFRDYGVEKEYGDGYYRVAFKDLITSTGTGEKSYYRYDITIETDDKKSAEDLIDLRKQSIAIINSVMTNFKPTEMNTEAKKMRVKRLIETKINDHYPNIAIKELYFTNFLYD